MKAFYDYKAEIYLGDRFGGLMFPFLSCVESGETCFLHVLEVVLKIDDTCFLHVSKFDFRFIR